MTCIICKQGDTRPGQVHVALQRGNSVVVIKNVPAEVCVNCQEYYLLPETTAAVLAKGEHAVQHGAEIEVVGFAA